MVVVDVRLFQLGTETFLS